MTLGLSLLEGAAAEISVQHFVGTSPVLGVFDQRFGDVKRGPINSWVLAFLK